MNMDKLNAIPSKVEVQAEGKLYQLPTASYM
jgi:hypothetical protein